MILLWRSAWLLCWASLISAFPSPCAAQILAKSDPAALNRQAMELFRAAKYREGIPLAQQALALAEQRFGPDHELVGRTLRTLAVLYREQGRLADAEPLFKRALALQERRFGRDHQEVGSTINGIAVLYRIQNRLGEAEPLFKRALAIRQKALGPDHQDVATTISGLAFVYQLQGRLGEAEPLFKRALAIRQKALGSDHQDIGSSLRELGDLYRVQERYAEAEQLLGRALSVQEKTLRPDHPRMALTTRQLADLHAKQGQFSKAEAGYKRSLAMRERAYGPEHSQVGTVLSSLASVYLRLGRYAEAEPLFKRALTIREKSFDQDHTEVADTLNGLAFLYLDQGRYSEAEPLFKRALAIREKVLGLEHVAIAATLIDLTKLYRSQGDYMIAERLAKRAVTAATNAKVPSSIGRSLGELGLLYSLQRRYDDAAPLLNTALAVTEKAHGPDHPQVAGVLSQLAGVYGKQRRFSEAELLLRRSAYIREKMLGPNHPYVAQSLFGLAHILRQTQRETEAETLFRRSMEIAEAAVGPDHPQIGPILDGLAWLMLARKNWTSAFDYLKQSAMNKISRSKFAVADIGEGLRATGKDESVQSANTFSMFVAVAHQLAQVEPGRASELEREMFLVVQARDKSQAALSLAQMGARQAVGGTPLALLVRERQDLAAEWHAVDRLLIAAAAESVGRRIPSAEKALRTRLAGIDKRVAEIDRTLAGDFPGYGALANPEPLSIADVQAHLSPDEVLVLFFDTPGQTPMLEESFVWFVTKTDSRWVRNEFGNKALTEHVAALHCGLHVAPWRGGASRDRCVDLMKAHSPREHIDGQVPEVLPFDLHQAYELYQTLLGPAEDLIRGKHLLIVPSGPLTSLPFQVLVTEAPKTRLPGTLSEYRDAAWLGMRQPLTILPSVTSLKALRQFARTSRATKTYLGIGNPLLDGPQDHPQWGAHYKRQAEAARGNQQCAKKAAGQEIALARGRRSVGGFAKVFRGAQADIEMVRAWTPLPETADELCDVGRRLGVPESEILLGSWATETTLKDLSEKGRLADYRIVHFATHGALTGEVLGLAEPGLVLTPPAIGTVDSKALERDDGFLTASEIATLKLDADWVILSACNTAGGGAENAEALSGMARAFFYAGARALLVSQWEVDSDAAVKLTTKAFAELKSEPAIGRAEAFRRSMRDLGMNGNLADAHPSMWAPFVVVGEGAK